MDSLKWIFLILLTFANVFVYGYLIAGSRGHETFKARIFDHTNTDGRSPTSVFNPYRKMDYNVLISPYNNRSIDSLQYNICAQEKYGGFKMDVECSKYMEVE